MEGILCVYSFACPIDLSRVEWSVLELCLYFFKYLFYIGKITWCSVR